MRIIDLVATGRNIKRFRLEAGLSVRDLQERLGFTSPQAICKWQCGLTAPTVDNLVILADVLVWVWMISLSGVILGARAIELRVHYRIWYVRQKCGMKQWSGTGKDI